jgi:hypothetical protein
VKLLTIEVPDPAVEALRRLAETELRSPQRQAVVLILDGLRRAAPHGAQARGERTGR